MLIPHQFPPSYPPVPRYCPTKGDTPPAGDARRKTDKETTPCSQYPPPYATNKPC